MIFNFEKMKEEKLENFKGGEKYIMAKMYVDDNNRILKATLPPMASIGEHTHDTSSEIIYILKGEAKIIYDGKEESAKAGDSHYCPKGHSHTIINNSNEDIIIFAVIPEQ